MICRCEIWKQNGLKILPKQIEVTLKQLYSFAPILAILIFTSIFKQIGRQMRDFVTALLLLKEVQKAGCIVFEEVKKTF